jgi:hypothetical protein
MHSMHPDNLCGPLLAVFALFPSNKGHVTLFLLAGTSLHLIRIINANRSPLLLALLLLAWL